MQGDTMSTSTQPTKRTSQMSQASNESHRRSKRSSKTSAHQCKNCGTPVHLSFRIPNSCKECGASFDPRPSWTMTATFFAATIAAVGVMVLLRQVCEISAIIIFVGLGAGYVFFNIVELLLFHVGILRLTNVNADDTLTGVSLHPTDDDALSKAEELTRSKTYAGLNKAQRTAQAQQLRESVQMAKSLRSGSMDNAPTNEASATTPVAERMETSEPIRRGKHFRKPTADAITSDSSSEQNKRRIGNAATSSTGSRPTRPRCRFLRLSDSNDADIRRMSSLATSIVREHFDPIVGVEQNDYMIARNQTPEAIASQITNGFEYYFVYPPRSCDNQNHHEPIGFLAVRAQDDGELNLSKFYLTKEERGKGYARSMTSFVAQRARKLGCDHVTLRVNRTNYQAILAYEHLGFRRVGELCTDIGGGFQMDDYVYELTLW